MSMKHTELTDDLQERASLYAAGAMTDSERLEYARHLEEDQCAVCRSEVKELQSAVSMLAFTIPSAKPSPTVRTRLMEQARASAPAVRERRQPAFGWLQWVTTVIAIASLAFAFMVGRTNTELRRVITILTSPSNRVIDLAGQGTNMQASGRIVVNQQERRWVVYVHDLPPLSADKSYQLWFVPKSGNPISATIFNTGPNGTTELEVLLPNDLPELQAAAVTTEPAGGLPQPRGAFALLGSM
jgi:anti-sigma-K factor RskA